MSPRSFSVILVLLFLIFPFALADIAFTGRMGKVVICTELVRRFVQGEGWVDEKIAWEAYDATVYDPLEAVVRFTVFFSALYALFIYFEKKYFSRVSTRLYNFIFTLCYLITILQIFTGALPWLLTARFIPYVDPQYRWALWAINYVSALGASYWSTTYHFLTARDTSFLLGVLFLLHIVPLASYYVGKGVYYVGRRVASQIKRRAVKENRFRIKGVWKWRYDKIIEYVNNSGNREAAIRDLEHDRDVALRLGYVDVAKEIRRALEYFREEPHRIMRRPRPQAKPAQEKPKVEPAQEAGGPASALPKEVEERLIKAAEERKRIQERHSLYESIASLKIFDRVVGLKDVKEAIAWRFLIPLLFPERVPGNVEPKLGILLYGPPGVGKTELMRALEEICNKLGIKALRIKPEDMHKKYVGEGERRIAEIFEEARRAPSVIFIDEAEAAMGRHLDDASPYHRGPTAQLLNEMDGLTKKPAKMLIVAATNKPWLIDEAFLRPGRIDEKFYVGPPTREDRVELFVRGLKDAKIAEPIDCEKLADLTAPNQAGYYSGADIMDICRRAIIAAAKSGRGVTMADLERVIAETKPNLQRQLVEQFNEYAGVKREEAAAKGRFELPYV
ncbi:ATP-binding protein [Thermofilum sp.]|uniref:ATP-binding protein n=1 Tax=Thermofilum sp. TaxID=1961369 RepID=UPI0031641704